MTVSKIGLINVAEFQDRIFFTITPHRWGNRAKIKSAEAHREYLRLKDLPLESDETGSGFIASKVASKVDKTSSTKELIDCPELDALNDYVNKVKDQMIGKLRGMANPSFIARGIYCLRKDLVTQAESLLIDAERKIRNQLSPAFEAAYDAAVEKAGSLPPNKGGLGPIFDPADYPTAAEAAARFSLEWSYLQMGVPDDLPAELRQQKEAEFTSKLQNAAEEIQNALRVSFTELVQHATEKLTVAPGEKPKVFRDTLISNIDDFISSFSNRSMGDQALADLVDKARAIIRPNGELIDPDKLRKFANVRDNIQNQFAQVQTALDSMIVERKGRKIDLSDED